MAELSDRLRDRSEEIAQRGLGALENPAPPRALSPPPPPAPAAPGVRPMQPGGPIAPPGPPGAPRAPVVTLPPTPPTEPAVSDGLLKDLAKTDPGLAYLLTREREQTEARDAARKVAKAERDKIIGRYDTDVAGLEAKLPTMPTAEKPGPLILPEPPSLKLRPFGAPAEGSDVWSALTNTIGALAQIGSVGYMAAKGVPTLALASYRGALKGWNEGDRERAEANWLDYNAQVGKLSAQHRALMDDWRATYEAYGHNLDRWKTEAGLLAVRHGMDAEKIKIAFENPAALDADLQRTQGQIDDAVKYMRDLNKTLLVEKIRAGEKEKDRAEKARHDREQEDYWRRRVEQVGQPKPATWKEYKDQVTPLEKTDGALLWVDKLDELSAKIDKKGLLPAGDMFYDQWTAWAQQRIQPGDKDFKSFTQLWNPIEVGQIDRGAMDEKGVRALAVFQQNINSGQMMSREAIQQYIRDLREGMYNKSVENLRMLETYGADPRVLERARQLVEKQRKRLEAEPPPGASTPPSGGGAPGWGEMRVK